MQQLVPHPHRQPDGLVGEVAQPRHVRELCAIEWDRAEADDLAAEQPDVVADLAARHEAWAGRCGVIPRETVLALYERRGKGLPPE